MITEAELQPFLDLLKSRGMSDEHAAKFAKLVPHFESVLGVIDVHQFPGCPRCGDGDGDDNGFNPKCANFKFLAAIEHPRAAQWIGAAFDAARPVTVEGIAQQLAERTYMGARDVIEMRGRGIGRWSNQVEEEANRAITVLNRATENAIMTLGPERLESFQSVGRRELRRDGVLLWSCDFVLEGGELRITREGFERGHQHEWRREGPFIDVCVTCGVRDYAPGR